ncbi:TPA: hypothetical protein ACTYB9_004116 [Klebsiella michiganensis]
MGLLIGNYCTALSHHTCFSHLAPYDEAAHYAGEASGVTAFESNLMQLD